MSEIWKKMNIDNFIRYVAPGIVLFGLVKAFNMGFCKNIENSVGKSLKGLVLVVVFLVAGTILHTLYRSIFYNLFILWLKDSKKLWIAKFLRRGDWSNYRDIIKEKYESLLANFKGASSKISSYHADWVWRRMKAEFAPDGYDKYDKGMGLWASSIHLLYFTGLSMIFLALIKLCYGQWEYGVWGLGIGFVTLIGGFCSDTDYERAETYYYEGVVNQDKLNKFIKKIFQSEAFRRTPRESRDNSAVAKVD